MNTSFVKIAVITFAIAVAIGSDAVYSQAPDSPPRASPKHGDIAPTPVTRETDPKLFENVVKFWDSEKRKYLDPTGEAQAAIANRLRSQPAPAVRATYFQSVLKNPDLPFRRWHLTVREISEVEGATRITVRVEMHLCTTAQVDGFLDETYKVDGDQLKLIKTHPPVDPAKPKQFIILQR